MPTLDVAWVKERDDNQRDVYLIIIPLDSSFGYKTTEEQKAAISELQARADNAGLVGTIVPVWEAHSGQMAFIAPKKWHPYFGSLNLALVAAAINRTLSW